MTPAQLSITEDRLRAVLHVPAHASVALEQLRAMVVQAGICVGLMPQRLVEAATPADEDRDVTVAIGKAPLSKGVIHFRSGVAPDGQAVAKGQILGEFAIDEHRDTASGLSVDNKPIEPSEELFTDFVIGGGLSLKAGHLISDREGLFVEVDGQVWRVIEDPRGRPKKDAIIFMAEDDHEAWVRLEAGEFVPPEILHKLLKQSDIVYGLVADGINRAIKGVKKPETVIVAQGSPAEDGADGRVEYLIDDRVDFAVREDGSLDFRSGNALHEVHQGTELARIHPPTLGTFGMSVRGRRLDPRPGRELDPAKYTGEGVTAKGIEPVTLIAERDGVYNRLVDGKVQVRELVLIDGDVDMKCGNIETEYPVHITGDIKMGFSVKSAGDIAVDGAVEDARVSAQGNLTVKGGILPGRQRVKAHGDVIARFVENRHVKARSALIQSSIRHSTIYATDEVVTQEVLGGHVVAGGDIVVKVAGDTQEQATVLQSGVDPRAQVLFDEAVEAKKHIVPELDRLREALDASVTHASELGQKAANFAQQAMADRKHLKRLKADGHAALERSRHLKAQVDELAERLEACDRVVADYESATSQSDQRTIRATANAFPGVEVRIGRHARKRLTALAGPSIFRLEEGRIVS